MTEKTCLYRKITKLRFFISFFTIILIFAIIGVSLQFVIIGLSFFSPIFWIISLLYIVPIEGILQGSLWYYEKSKYNKAINDNWKRPEKSEICEPNSIFPKCLKEIHFKFKTIIGEPLFIYHIFYHFIQIESGWNSAVKNKQYSAELDHDAIIVNIYSKLGKEYIFGDGVDLLVNFFVERKIPFKVYCCFNSEQFFNIVNNPKCKTLWLFGHGDRGGISCSDKFVDYSELVNKISPLARSKRYIYQFHCNCGCKNSLADYLSNGRGFANYTYLDKGGEVRGYIENIIQDESWEKYDHHR